MLRGLIFRVVIAVIGTFSLIASAKANEKSVMSCQEFSHVLRFIQSEHLRFHVDKKLDVMDLYQDAADHSAKHLHDLGYHMQAAQFDRKIHPGLNFKRDKQLYSVREICKRLGSSLFRAIYLKAYAKELDPYTDFYLAEEMRVRSSAVNGEFIGVGIGTDLAQDHLVITEVVAGGPSEDKLHAGDKIYQVDHYPVKGMNTLEVRQRIRGKLNTKVEFSGVRNTGEPFSQTITRGRVTQKSVTHSWPEADVLKIQIHRFFSQTVDEVETLIVEHRHHLKGLILDLRDNSGGLLQSARDVVDLFIEQGVIVYLQGLYEDQVWALREGGYTDLPIVVLVNERTASASEIVAGAFQDYGRAIVIGQPTYGKHCVQNIYETQTALGTSYHGGLKLTTLWYYLPSGRSVKNFKPDIVLADRAKPEDRLNSQMPYEGPGKIIVPTTANTTTTIQSQFVGHSKKDYSGENSEKIGIKVLKKILAQSSGD